MTVRAGQVKPIDIESFDFENSFNISKNDASNLNLFIDNPRENEKSTYDDNAFYEEIKSKKNQILKNSKKK